MYANEDEEDAWSCSPARRRCEKYSVGTATATQQGVGARRGVGDTGAVQCSAMMPVAGRLLCQEQRDLMNGSTLSWG